MKFRIVDKNKFIFTLLSMIIIIALIVAIIIILNSSEDNEIENFDIQETVVVQEPVKKEITDWRLTLVNINNYLPENYVMELVDLDEHRKFDSRAINELKEMIDAERKSGASSMWAQSTYRSIEAQEKVFNSQVQEYMNQGKTKQEAEELTLKIINKPGTSEHNLGLAVDFNYATEDFENTTAFTWLKQNAENYGFILRYPKDKEEITKVTYEPWHWRYVGVENAKEINKLGYCLEEYIEYLLK